jgi:hypothetical protein
MAVMLRRFLRRLAGRVDPVLLSDTGFLERAYREILGRDADKDGIDYYRALLREGARRTDVLISLVRSEEFTSKGTKAAPVLASLRASRPDRYRDAVDRTNGQGVVVFEAAGPLDFDWLEAAILQNGYYEQPGVWNFGVDTDKRVMAEIVASFAPERALELGCAAGAVLACLHELGIAAEGVEISAMALARAPAAVRPRIHHGDLLAVELPAAYDIAFGLDIFEHLNPNRLEAYLAKLARLTRAGGYVFCNVPAFGPDPVFGTVFPFYLDGWEREAAAGSHFSTLHVDELGYPLHGHLIWADAQWWVRRFEAQGLRREIAVERALHRKYDDYMDRRSRARKAFLIFSKQGDPGRSQAVADRIRQQASRALA